MSRVEVSTTDYRFSHGREPRGRGDWAFFFEGEAEPRFFRGSFAEAKKQAEAAARAAQVRRVKVGA